MVQALLQMQQKQLDCLLILKHPLKQKTIKEYIYLRLDILF